MTWRLTPRKAGTTLCAGISRAYGRLRRGPGWGEGVASQSPLLHQRTPCGIIYRRAKPAQNSHVYFTRSHFLKTCALREQVNSLSQAKKYRRFWVEETQIQNSIH